MSERDLHEWTRARLSEQLDGGLSRSEREAVARHLEACPACREVREELERVSVAARGLGPIEPPSDLWPAILERIGADDRRGRAAHPDVLPLGARTAPGGDAGSEAGGSQSMDRSAASGTAAMPGTPSAPGAPSPWRRRPSPPLLAAAAVVLVAVSASLAWWGRGAVEGTPSLAGADMPSGMETAARPVASVPAGPASEALARELEGLESVIAESRERLAPGTVAVLERNLLLIERAIEDSYRALALDPENDFVRDHLERTYERKLEYLREIASIVERAG